MLFVDPFLFPIGELGYFQANGQIEWQVLSKTTELLLMFKLVVFSLFDLLKTIQWLSWICP